MRGGRLRHRVLIQRPDPTVDAMGQPVRGWSDVVCGWSASIEPLNGREYFRAQESQSETTVRMRLRYGSEISGITSDWRITHDSNVYDIQSIIQPGNINQEIILMCSEGVTSG